MNRFIFLIILSFAMQHAHAAQTSPSARVGGAVDVQHRRDTQMFKAFHQFSYLKDECPQLAAYCSRHCSGDDWESVAQEYCFQEDEVRRIIVLEAEKNQLAAVKPYTQGTRPLLHACVAFVLANSKRTE